MRVILCVAICLIQLVNGVKIVNLYQDEANSGITVLDKRNFDANVYNSGKVWYVEFYAHWCGACKRFKSKWLEVGKLTKDWQKANIVRVGAINCGDEFNDEFCREHEIMSYPTVRLYQPTGRSQVSVKADQTSTNLLLEQLVDFIEKSNVWPNLQRFTSNNLSDLFIDNPTAKFALLVVENDRSNLGKKLVLDFSPYASDLVIRRSTKTFSNVKELPTVFLIDKSKSKNQAVVLDESTVETYNPSRKSTSGKRSMTDDDFYDKYSQLILKLIKYQNLSKEVKTSLVKINTPSTKIENPTQFDINSIQDKVYMQDLESSLNVLLRSDVARLNVITGDKLQALKVWLRVLAKYFPGRKPVRNYLKNLNDRIANLNEITSDQWKSIVDEQRTNSFLPHTAEWFHCRGSQPKYRGYPCSLWTLFHVLTVSQFESWKSKSPLAKNFEVKEVMEAVRLFVVNFFTCKECSKNFAKETLDYANLMRKPTDCVMYLWMVHNNVNERLANEADQEQDPSFPKQTFPSEHKCPKCVFQDATGRKLWNNKEVLNYLVNYYSAQNFVPLENQKSTTRLRSIGDDQLSATNKSSTKAISSLLLFPVVFLLIISFL